LRQFSFILIILLSIFLFGCTSTTPAKNIKLEKDLYKGTSGVLMDIYQDKIPSEVYEGETFDIVVKVDNKGPYKVDNADLLISLDKGFMSFRSGGYIKSGALTLEGKTVFNEFDDFRIVSESVTSGQIDPLKESQNTLMLTTLCYDYKGIAVGDVCVDTDPYNTGTMKKICEVTPLSLSDGQGGPLSISDIEVRMLIDQPGGQTYIRPQLKIHFLHQGTGTIMKAGNTNIACSGKPFPNGIQSRAAIIDLKLSQYGLSDFECFPNEIILIGNEDTITCTLKSGRINKNRGTFKSPLTITYAYGYVSSLSKEIKIKKLL